MRMRVCVLSKVLYSDFTDIAYFGLHTHTHRNLVRFAYSHSSSNTYISIPTSLGPPDLVVDADVLGRTRFAFFSATRGQYLPLVASFALVFAPLERQAEQIHHLAT